MWKKIMPNSDFLTNTLEVPVSGVKLAYFGLCDDTIAFIT